MLRFPILIASVVIFATMPMPVKADSVLGKTIKANWRYEGCGENGRCSQGSGNVNVYISTEGNIFDYAKGSRGAIYKLGQPASGGVTYSASGNVFTASAPKFDLLFTISGRRCVMSLNMHGSGSLRLLSQSCSVVAGQSGR